MAVLTVMVVAIGDDDAAEKSIGRNIDDNNYDAVDDASDGEDNVDDDVCTTNIRPPAFYTLAAPISTPDCPYIHP